MSHALHARIVSEVLAGLHYAHELTDYDGTALRIVHRDVSPQNVFVTYDGQVKLVDFGIAKTHDSGTQAGVFKGKFAYTSPEQIRGERIDRRADVFAAGIVLWEMLTGQKLLDGNNPAEIVGRLLNHAIPTVRSVAPAVDMRLEAIVTRALERNPSARYETAQAMRDALEEYLAASGQNVRHDEIAQLVCETFRKERTRVQQAIKDELAGLANTQSSSRVIAARRLPLGDQSVSVQASAPGVTRAAEPQIEVLNESSSRSLARRGGFVLGGMALAALIYAAARPRTTVQPVIEPAASIAPPAATPTPTPSVAVVATPTTLIVAEAEESHAPKVKWVPHAKKAPASASTTIAAPTPPPTPPPTTEPSSKEKRKFRVEL